MTDTFVQVLDNSAVVIVEGPTPAPTIIEVGLQGPAGVSDATTFLGLADTPTSFSGQGGRVVRVNTTEDALEFVAAADTGTVTSVGLSLPAQFTVAGSPITAAGTLVAEWEAQAANSVLAGPASGSPAAPTFRALVDADVPGNIVRNARQVASGTGLAGGGDLSADRTLSLTGQALAIHTLASNGIVARTAVDTFNARTLSAGANISVTNGDGVAGNPTIAVVGLATVATTGSASDLTTGTLPISRGGTGAATAADARTNLSVPPTSRAINTNNGLTGGGDLSADRTLGLTGQALALHNLATNGVIARTGAGTVAARTISAGANIAVTNGDGVSGNPTIAVTGLAAVATSGSASDLTTGTLALARIAQGGATSGQVLKWSGSAWAPATDETGGGSEGYASQRTLTSSGNITNADRNGVVYINGSGITATFVRAGFSPRDRVLLINIGSGAATVSAGTDGFNVASNDSFLLFPGEEREVVYEGTADPYWRVAVPSTIELAANQVATLNNAGTAFEARTEKIVGTAFLPITGNVAGGAAEGQIGMWGNKPCTLTAVRARTLGGTCSIQIRKNGTAINGFGSAVAQTTTVTNTASTETLAQDDVLDVVVTSASSLTGIFITFLGVRTAD